MPFLNHDAWSEWADRRLLPGTMTILLVADMAVGLNWLLSPESDLKSPAYDIGVRLLPMHSWGAVFIALTACTIGAVGAGGRRFFCGYLIGPLLGGLWLFWAVLFTMGTWGLNDGASSYNSITASLACALHLLVGLAVAYRPGVPLPSTVGR